MIKEAYQRKETKEVSRYTMVDIFKKQPKKRSMVFDSFDKKRAILYVITFVLLIVLCYLFPYTGDDWAWGSSIGIDRLNSGFADYGGRYLGYIIVMAITRFRVLRALVMASTFFGLGIFIRKIVKTEWSFWGALLLTMTVSGGIFAQSIAWTSGFANYATTALVLFIFLAIVFNIILENKDEKIWLRIFMLLLGFSGSLIMENVTLFFVIMPVLLQIYLLVKEKRFSFALALFMLGALVGAIWMFSNSAYSNIASEQDSYRSMSLSIGGLLMQAKENYLGTIYNYGLFKNVVLVLSLAMGGSLIVAFKKGKRDLVSVISLAVFGFYMVVVLVGNTIVGDIGRPVYYDYFEAIVSAVALISYCVFSLYNTTKGAKEKKVLVVLWVTFFVLIGPLFVITPIGPRNLFAPYLVLATISLVEWRIALHEFKIRSKRYNYVCYFDAVARSLAVMTICVFIGIFVSVYKADNKRLEYVKNEVEKGETEVVIDHLPFESLMWMSTPPDDKFIMRFKLYYGVPLDVVIKISPNML